MRLFVAIEVGDAVAAAAARLVATLSRRVERVPGAKVTWVSAERMHLTVRFIGEVDEARAGRIADTLAPGIPVSPFTIDWGGVHAFPGLRRPRVIVGSVSAGSAPLLQVEQIVSGRLEPLGVSRESRPYTPHLTLGRVREAGRLQAARLLEGLEHETLGATPVEAITLFESDLSPKGPRYVALRRARLTGPGR